jgi:hypothetical protein
LTHQNSNSLVFPMTQQTDFADTSFLPSLVACSYIKKGLSVEKKLCP